MTEETADTAAAAPAAAASTPPANPPAGAAPKPSRGRARQGKPRADKGTPPQTQAPRVPHPVLEQLASLYPALFGANFLPLKRGIFHDLIAAHPEVFTADTLKPALALHTRSGRYLNAVAEGLKRHDLQGQPVEDMAPEHVYHALQETFRRRQQRTPQEDLAPKLRKRIAQAFDASGLTREAYVDLVRGKDDKANALLDEAMALVAERNAKDEALLRAFDASGQAMEAFADMYGMDPRATAQAVERARQRR